MKLRILMYKIMKEDIHRFDTSDYDENNQFGLPRVHKKVPGLMKDKCNGTIMKEFIGLRSKMYSILVEDGKTVKKAKGIKSGIVKKSITFEDHRRCLQDLSIIEREHCNIRSKLHIVHTEKQKKIALSPHDSERFLMSFTADTLPLGHQRVVEEQMAQAALQMEGESEEKMDHTEQEKGGRMVIDPANGDEVERKYEAANENEGMRSVVTLYGSGGEEVKIEFNVVQEFSHEWDLSLVENVSEEREGDILEEAMEGAGIEVGNRLYEQEKQGDEHIQPSDELESNPPCQKKRRLN